MKNLFIFIFLIPLQTICMSESDKEFLTSTLTLFKQEEIESLYQQIESKRKEIRLDNEPRLEYLKLVPLYAPRDESEILENHARDSILQEKYNFYADRGMACISGSTAEDLLVINKKEAQNLSYKPAIEYLLAQKSKYIH